MWDLANLFRRYSRELQGYLRRRGVTADTAADLSQDAFVRLAQLVDKTPMGELPSNGRAYLYRTAINLQIDAQRRVRIVAPAGAIDLDAIVDPAPQPDELLISAEQLRLLERALMDVPEGPRLVYDLRMEGLTFAEIAERLSIPLQTAYSRLASVLMHLQTQLRKANEGGKRWPR